MAKDGAQVRRTRGKEANQEPLPAGVTDRMAAGRALRERVPRRSHAEWTPAADRPDPLALLGMQDQDRLQDLVPIRYGRMVISPFTFLRGSAIVMAADLAATPSTGIRVQACGDAHLSNFGVFATPERHLIFDLNDFDETLPGPWEWDLKRLAASFVVASRYRGWPAATGRQTVMTMVRQYQLRMREFAAMRNLDVWYTRLDVEQLLAALPAPMRARTEGQLAKARTRDSLQAHAKLTEVVDGQRRIKPDPPLVQRVDSQVTGDIIRRAFVDYRKTLQGDRRDLLSRFRYVDVALKVVGVGSVGTRCFIVLLEGRDQDDPLFLQIKEANRSVLESHHGKSRYQNQGQRVVEGQRLTQAASDMFLGWIRGSGEEHRDFYWRQLRDMKGSADIETILPQGFVLYGGLCGAALARAHARSGDAAMITGYVGTGEVFAEAIADFSEAYADQTERDHQALATAVSRRKIKAVMGL